jgi:chromosomal replication initiation ATPase DnaA
MGFATASSPVVITLKPGIKSVKRLNKERMDLRLERLAEERLLKEQPAAPTVDPVAEMVAKYREIKTPQGNKRIVETKQVVAAIAQRHGVTFNDIMGPSRKRNIVAARFEAIVTVAQLRHLWSLPEIGRFFGNRDHTTILHAIRTQAVKTGETIKGYTPEEAAYLLNRQRDKNRSAIKTYRSKRNAKVAS